MSELPAHLAVCVCSAQDGLVDLSLLFSMAGGDFWLSSISGLMF